MRTIVITISGGFVSRDILRTFLPEKFLADPEVRLVFLVPREKRDDYEREFGSERVIFVPWHGRPPTFFNKALLFLARNGTLTETVLTDQATRRLRGGSWLTLVIKRIFTYAFGRSKLFHRTLRFLASFRKPFPETRKLFQEFPPALLFVTDVQDEMDLDAMAAAREAGVKIVGMVRSWDNLTSGGLVQMLPEILLVWSPYINEKAVGIQHIPEKIVHIVGIPHYDWYARRELILPRGKFLKQFGISPEKRVILFAGIGNFLSPKEPEIVEILSENLEQGAVKENVAAIFRPHPHFLTEEERIRKLGNIVFDGFVAQYGGNKRSRVEIHKEHTIHYMNSLFHADLIITAASTVTMDAVAFGKPVICVAFDGKSNLSYWDSVRRYYSDYTHYKDLTATGGFKVAYNAEDLIRYINEYFKNPALDADGRKKIIERFIWKLDGQSAERIAETLLKNIQ